MIRGMPNVSDLAELPRRAVVAVAVRCARRVQPWFQELPEEHAGRIDQALSLVEGLINQEEWSSAKVGREVNSTALFARAAAARGHRDAALAVPFLARVGDAVAMNAHFAAAQAAATAVFALGSLTKSEIGLVEAAVDADYQRLQELNLGVAETVGSPFDPTESGPLGALWPAGIPSLWQSLAAGESSSRSAI